MLPPLVLTVAIRAELWRPLKKLETLSSIEDRGQTDRVTALPRLYVLHVDLWPYHSMTVTLSPRRAMVMTHKYTKSQVQRSSGSNDSMKTNGRTDGRTLPIILSSG